MKIMERQEEKMCLAQVEDKIVNAKRQNKIENTDFLDMYQLFLARSYLKKNNIANYKLYGGYEEAERKVLIAYPENEDEIVIKKQSEDILKIVRIKLPEEEKGKYTHRNYLGGIIRINKTRN